MFAARALLAMMLLYGFYYFPYPEESMPGRLISAYLGWQTQLVGRSIQLLGDPVTIQGTLVGSAFSLHIVKDCSSLDAQALFAGAVLAFPARASAKAVGVLAGLLLLNLANVARMVALYFVGARRPQSFDWLHEEVMPLLLVFMALGAFAAWVMAVGKNDGAQRVAPT